jgi:hypothetical protein
MIASDPIRTLLCLLQAGGRRLGAAFRRLGRDDNWRPQLSRFMESQH